MVERRISVSKPPYAALWKSSIWRIQLVENHPLQPLGYVTAASSGPLQFDRQGSHGRVSRHRRRESSRRVPHPR